MVSHQEIHTTTAYNTHAIGYHHSGERTHAAGCYSSAAHAPQGWLTHDQDEDRR